MTENNLAIIEDFLSSKESLINNIDFFCKHITFVVDLTTKLIKAITKHFSSGDKFLRKCMVRQYIYATKWSLLNRNELNISLALVEKNFKASYKSTNIEIFKTYLNYYPLTDISSGGTEACMRYLCKKGAIEVIEFIISMNTNINIHAKRESCFRNACINGHREVARLLLKKFRGINVNIKLENTFQKIIERKHYKMGRFLLRRYLTSSEYALISIIGAASDKVRWRIGRKILRIKGSNNKNIFIQSVKGKRSFEVAPQNGDGTTYDKRTVDFCFKYSCKMNNADITQYLVNIFPGRYTFETFGDKILSFMIDYESENKCYIKAGNTIKETRRNRRKKNKLIRTIRVIDDYDKQ